MYLQDDVASQSTKNRQKTRDTKDDVWIDERIVSINLLYREASSNDAYDI